MPHHDTPFGDPVAPGRRVTDLEGFLPLAAKFAGSSWRQEAVLVALDQHWRAQPAVTVVSDVPSVPALLEAVLGWHDEQGRSAPQRLDMRRVICVSSAVPFRIDPAFDWFDCDDVATKAGVQLVEWIALDHRTSLLPRVQAGVEARWPAPT